MAYTPTDWECGQTVTAEKLNNIERGVAEVNSEYTPTTWQCGDVITAEKMNKIEQGIANAGGGGGSWTVLTEESVTTAQVPDGINGMLTYAEQISQDSIKVTFNGTEYECEKRIVSKPMGDQCVYGADGTDWSQYPFMIMSGPTLMGITNFLYTETAGTYTIKIEASQSGGSSDFSTAEVTFICNAESEVECKLAIAEKADPPFIPNPQTNSFFTLVNGDESTVAAVLYKGTNCCVFIGATQVSGTGDVSVLSAGQAYITGDCTITIS